MRRRRKPNASTSSPDNPPKSDATENHNCIPKSRFRKTVCLSNWWLSKAEDDFQGGGLCVSGFTSRERRAMRVFSSAPIVKSHDMFTLETTDGICVLIKGFIDDARTLENGFTSDVFDHFVFGFPPYWKEYAEKCMGGRSNADSNERGDESRHKMDAERSSSKTKSSTIKLPPKCANGDHLKADTSVYCFIKKESTTLRCGGHAIISPDGGILSTCHLNYENRGGKATATPGSCSKLQGEHEDNQISDGISRGYRTRSKSALLAACEKVKLGSVTFMPRDRNNLHCGGIGFKDPVEMSETPNRAKDQRIAETKGSMDQAIVKGTRSQDGHGAADNKKEHAVKNESRISEKDGKSKKTRRELAYVCEPFADNKEHAVKNESSTSEKDGMSKKTRRKLAYETPRRDDDGVLSGSSKSLSFSLSRSGRLLIPTLKFWRNERALYDAEGSVTGIEEEIVPEHSIKGKNSRPQRRRRRLV